MASTIRGIHAHVGIVTNDLDAAMASMSGLLGLTFEEPFDGSLAPPFAFGDGTPAPGLRRVTTSLGGPMRVELLEGLPGSVWHTTAPAELHHVAYWVDDVTSAAEALVADGWSVEVTIMGADSRPTEFAYLTKPGEARVEVTATPAVP
jgi:catechol 2,3-dioxygenase-like lactoylglutathione lyase family enzyme